MVSPSPPFLQPHAPSPGRAAPVLTILHTLLLLQLLLHPSGALSCGGGGRQGRVMVGGCALEGGGSAEVLQGSALKGGDGTVLLYLQRCLMP